MCPDVSNNEFDQKSSAKDSFGNEEANHPFMKALSKIVKADAVSSRAAIQASKATKPSLHKRFVHDPAKDHA